MLKATIYTVTLFVAIFQACSASQEDVNSEIDNYIEIFGGESYARQRKAIEPLGWSGISDPKLYEIVESKLLGIYSNSTKDEAEKGAWYAKVLALSGDTKYLKTLKLVSKKADSGKLRKHARVAVKRLNKYAVWNPEISKGVETAPVGRLEEFRIANMLKSDNLDLVVLGAKRVYYAHGNDETLIEMVRNRLLKDYQHVGRDDDKKDAAAWLIKALSQSGNPADKEVLIKIIDTAKNRKIKKYAKKYVEYL